MEANIRCPKCHREFAVPFGEIAPGRQAGCPHCGQLISFSGQDASKVQEAIDQLTGQLGSSSVKVTVKTKVRHPWWQIWKN